MEPTKPLVEAQILIGDTYVHHTVVYLFCRLYARTPPTNGLAAEEVPRHRVTSYLNGYITSGESVANL